MSEKQSIRDELSETLFLFYDHGTQPNALVEADALLASSVIRRIQAEALREAALSGSFGTGAQSTLLARADRIEGAKF